MFHRVWSYTHIKKQWEINSARMKLITLITVFQITVIEMRWWILSLVNTWERWFFSPCHRRLGRKNPSTPRKSRTYDLLVTSQDVSDWITSFSCVLKFGISWNALTRSEQHFENFIPFMIFDILCFNFRNTLLTECWRKDPDHRPEPVKILELLSAHPVMVTACLDSPMSSVVRDEEDCVRPDSIRKGSVRTWRGTPSPSPTAQRSRTITQLTQNQIKVLMPHSENGGAVAGAV